MAVRHTFVSPKSDGTDSTLVRPSNWNADHTITADTIANVLSDHNKAAHDSLGIDAATVNDITSAQIINTMSTGLLGGGYLSANTDTSKFDIYAGSGIIVDSYTNPLIPTLTPVSWITKTAIVDTYLASADSTYIAIDSSGNVVQKASVFTSAERRQYIYLGVMGHPDRANETYPATIPFLAYDSAKLSEDFFSAYGSMNVGDGNVYGPNGANLYIDKSVGQTFEMGGNYVYDRQSPNIVQNAAVSPTGFLYAYRYAPGLWAFAPSSVADPDQYDTGSGLGAVPAGGWTIQYIYLFGEINVTGILYGQTLYTSIEVAEANIQSNIELTPILSSAVFRGWLIIQKGCTSLLPGAGTAKFISAGKFGLILGGGGAGEANTASNIGSGGVGVYDDKVGVDLQFKNIKAAASGLVDVVDNGTDNTIELDLNLNMISHTELADIGNHSHGDIDSFIDAGAMQGIAAGGTTYTSGQVIISAQANITINSSTDGASQYIQFSVDPAGTGGGGILALSGSNSSFTANTATFGISNGITFYVTNGSMVAAHNGITSQTAEARVVSLQGTSGSLSLVGASNITVSALNGSTITIYGPANILNSLSIGGNTGTSGSSNITGGGFVIAGGSNVTLSMSNNSISIHAQSDSAQPRVVSLQGTSGSLSLVGASNVTVSALNGSTITIYGPANILNSLSVGGNTGTSGSSAITGGGFVLAGGSNITLSQSNNSISIHAQSDSAQPRVVSLQGTSGSLSLVGASNVTVSALNGSTITIYGPANILNSFSLGGNTATTGSSAITGGGYVLAGGANITMQQSNNTISISAAAPGGGGGVGALGNTVATSTYTSGTVIFSGLANMTINTSVDGVSQYLQFSAPAGGAGVQQSYWGFPQETLSNFGSLASQGTLQVWPLKDVPALVASRADFQASLNAFTNATQYRHGLSVTLHMGLYGTTNATQLTLLSSGSVQFTYSNQSTNGSANNTSFVGMRNISIPITVNHDGKDLWAALRWSVSGTTYSSSTTTGSGSYTSLASWSWFGVAPMTFLPCEMGANTTATGFRNPPFLGYLSASTNTIPNNIGLSQLIVSASASDRMYRLAFRNF